MGIEENEDVVREFVAECINPYRPELLERFVGEAVRAHPGTPGTAPDTEGIDQVRDSVHRIRGTFPDLHVDLEQVGVDLTPDATGPRRRAFAGEPRP